MSVSIELKQPRGNLLPPKMINDLYRIACRCLMVLCIAAPWLTTAQAATIGIRVAPKHLFNYPWGPYTDYFHDSVEDAFTYYKSIKDGCSPVTPNDPVPYCVFSTNLRPYDAEPPSTAARHTLNILMNGIPYLHVFDRTLCHGGSCSPTSIGAGWIQQRLQCPQGPISFSQVSTSAPTEYYDLRSICVTYIGATIGPNTEPCSDCDGKGDSIHAGTGQKFQVETDYIGAAGGLQFQRTYRSTNGFSSPATSSLIDNSVANVILPGCYPGFFVDVYGRTHQDCYPYVTSGTPDYTLLTPDGRTIAFSGPLNAITARADVNDKLSQRTNTSGAIEWVVQRADNSTEIYNAQGLLIRKTSIGGKDDATYTYSDATTAAAIAPRAGLLIRMTDRFGRPLNFTYDASARMTTMTDPAGGVFQYAYDASSNLSSVTYPDQTVRLYHYNEAANINNGVVCSGKPAGLPFALTGITEDGARFSTFKYNCDGKAVSTEHAGGLNKHSFTYVGAGAYPAANEVDPLGTLRAYKYQEILAVIRPTGTTQPAASGTGTVSNAITYDANGNVSWRTDFNGNRTGYTYDLTRNLETQRREGLTAAGGTTAQTRTISTQWHATFRLPVRVAEPLRRTTYIYNGDAGGACGFNADGTVLPGALCAKTVQATTDTTGAADFSATPTGAARTWTYTYNANGLVLTINGPRTDVSNVTTYTYYTDDDADIGRRGNIATIANALGQVTSITAYNAHGQPLTIVNPNGLTTTLTYDARQRLTSREVGGETTTYTYDGVGQLTQVTLPDGSSLTYSYDAAHRLTDMADNLGNRISYMLDAIGNRTQERVFDPLNALAQTRSRVFSNLNRLFQDIGAQNQTTQYAYDNQGNLTSMDGPLTGAVDVTTNAYDALNRLIRVTDPNLGQTRYAYNGIDQLTSVTDPRNLATTYNYDGLANLNAQVSPDTGTTANTYDTAGNLLTQTDAKGQITNYAYDALNRVTSITFAGGSKQTYSYDQGANGIGRLTGITELSPSLQVTNQLAYAYDPKGRVSFETRTINGVAYALAYSYDGAGRLSGLTYPSGRTIAYSFDALGRTSQVSTTPQGGATQSVASNIAYQPFGGVKSYTLGNGQGYSRSYDTDGRIASYSLGSQIFALGYDAAGRIAFIVDAANPVNANTYGYDNLDRLTSAVLPNLPFAYNYDAVGNRLAKTVGSATDTYAYGAASNRLASITAQAGATRTYGLDANGSTVNDGINQYVYDIRGRMVQSVGALGATTYQVNALGQRIRKTNSTEDRVFLYDTQGHLIAEADPAGTITREYLYLNDMPLAVAVNAAVYYVHPDHLNTPRLIADSTGTTVWRWDQGEPFGSDVPNNNPSGVGAFDFPLRFPGQYFDRETGLFYNVNRDYDSGIGRYPESDPVGLSAGLNTYLYVGGNPISKTDPRGLDNPRLGPYGSYYNLPPLDIPKFVDWLNNNANNASLGQCAKYVREGLEAGGGNTSGHPAYAKDWGNQLQRMGFIPIPSDNYVPQSGDVTVFQSRPGSSAGHIQGYDGDQWISDFFQNGFWPGSVYRNANTPNTTYRHP
jgi:RHS repeat-associated protein